MATSEIDVTTQTGGPGVATAAISEGGGTRHIQRVTLDDRSGNELGPATSDVDPLTPVATTLDAAHLAFVITRACWLYNESDTRIYVGFSAALTDVNGAIIVEPDSQILFAPPRDAAYRGNVYIYAAGGVAGKKLRIQPW